MRFAWLLPLSVSIHGSRTLTRKLRYFRYHTPLAPLTASSRWNFRDPVVVLVTCPSRRVGNDGTDCRSVAAFEGEDCRYLLFARLPDGRSRPPRSRQVGFRSRPHRGRVLYRCDAALLSHL